MITTWDNHVCHTNLHKEHRSRKNNNSALGETCASPKHYISILILHCHHGNARKKRWTSAIPRSRKAPSPYKDAFWADEPGCHTRRDRDIVARRPGIFPLVTRSRHSQLHLMHSKKRNIAACIIHAPPTARHQTQLQQPTRPPPTRVSAIDHQTQISSDPNIGEKTGPSTSRHHRLNDAEMEEK
jgi:hypothetical protein